MWREEVKKFISEFFKKRDEIKQKMGSKLKKEKDVVDILKN